MLSATAARATLALLAALAAAGAWPLAAEAKPPAVADHPLPPPRPPELGGAAREAAPAPAPAQAPVAEAQGPPEPYGPPIPADLRRAPAPPTVAQGDVAGCLARLKELGVAFEPKPDIAAGSCGAAAPVRVTALSPSLALSTPSTMVCPMAEALARWTREAVEPAAREYLDDRLKRLAIGTHYECRPQRGGGKLSEHAFANAVDVMGFEFEKRPAVPVAFHADGSPPDRFQDAVQAKACAFFSTVLGPGSDAAHADHLHLDLRQRKRGFTLCQ